MICPNCNKEHNLFERTVIGTIDYFLRWIEIPIRCLLMKVIKPKPTRIRKLHCWICAKCSRVLHGDEECPKCEE